MCNLYPLLKVPDTVEVSMRQKDGTKIYFVLNHQETPRPHAVLQAGA